MLGIAKATGSRNAWLPNQPLKLERSRERIVGVGGSLELNGLAANLRPSFLAVEQREDGRAVDVEPVLLEEVGRGLALVPRLEAVPPHQLRAQRHAWV